MIYFKNPKEIPQKIYRSIKKFEGNKFKIIYFTYYANFYFFMLKQGGFAPSYVSKIFTEENSKVVAVRNFYLTAPYYLNEFAQLKWGCAIYTTK